MRAHHFTAIAITTMLCLGTAADAQNYRTGVGLRAGSPLGFTVKHFMTERSAIEGIIGGRNRGIEGTVLYEYHVYPARRKEFDLYFGGGGHVGIYSDPHHNHRHFPHDHDHDGPGHDHDDPFLNLGVDGIVGVSWTFTNAPVNLGFDYKPGFSLYRYIGYFYGDAAISVRYAFGSRSDRNGRNAPPTLD